MDFPSLLLNSIRGILAVPFVAQILNTSPISKSLVKKLASVLIAQKTRKFRITSQLPLERKYRGK
jgi:hypothetical protein